jgi:Flp pilus assembly protein TadD
VLHFRQHDFGAAVAALRRALALDPDDGHTRHQLALALLARGEADSARRELSRVLRFDPGANAARIDLAVLEIAQERRAEAVVLLDEALQLAPEDPRALHYRALAEAPAAGGRAAAATPGEVG